MKRKYAIIGGIVFVLLGLVTFYSFKTYVFSSPKRCKACHFMEPYYKKWETSTHNKVPCLKCHDYSPLNAVSGQLRFLVGTYDSRPLTTVPDKNCLQSNCHDKRLIESKAIFTKRGIAFDHKPHFEELRRGVKLHCRSCHSDIVQGEHVAVSKSVCYLCHFKGVTEKQALTGCPSCHSAPTEDIVYKGKPFSHQNALSAGNKCNDCHIRVVDGDGDVSKDKCFFCHIERTEAYTDVEFMHEKHVTEKQLDCLFCHDKIHHGYIEMAEEIPGI